MVEGAQSNAVKLLIGVIEMTRKRYIKLLMSYGYPRNGANGLAARAVLWYGSYQNAWEKQLPNIKIMYGITAMAGSLNKVFREIGKASETVGERIARIVEAIREATQKYEEEIKRENTDNNKLRACSGYGHNRDKRGPRVQTGAVRRYPPYRRTAPTG